jgi:hypothetical protein
MQKAGRVPPSVLPKGRNLGPLIQKGQMKILSGLEILSAEFLSDFPKKAKRERNFLEGLFSYSEMPSRRKEGVFIY